MKVIRPLPGVSIGFFLISLASPSLGATTSEAAAVYERERTACITGQSNQDRETCLREAAAARAEAMHRASSPDEATLQANRIRRCAALPAEERRDCELRMSGAGTQSGSVAEGGIYRELVTRDVGAPIAAPASPAAAASAAN